MTTLKDKGIIGHSPYILFKYEDVKEHILKFQNQVLEKEIYGEDLLIYKYKQIFGDFEK